MSPRESEQEETTTQKAKRNQGIAIVGILAVVAVLILISNHTLLLSSAFSTSNYTISPNINLYPNAGYPTGGAIISIGSTSIYKTSSGPGGLQGTLYYVSAVLNGAGEALFGSSGTSATNIASALNSSVTASSNPIGINFGVVNESFIIPYGNSNLSIFLIGINHMLVSYNVPTASLGNSCSGSYNSNYDGYSNVYEITCSGINNPENDFASDLNGFSTACSNQNNNKATPLYIQYTPGISSGEAYSIYMICAKPLFSQYTKGGIYSPQGTAQVFYNVSVYFTNTTQSQTIYLTPQRTSGYLNNQNVFAQIVSLQASGLQVGTAELPAVINLNNSQSSTEYVNPLLLASAVSLSLNAQTGNNGGFLSNWLQNPINICSGTIISGCQNVQVPIYPFNLTQNQASQYNNEIFGDIVPQNPANFYNGNLQPVNGTYNFVVKFPSSHLPYYPEIQLFAKENTLGIVVPQTTAPPQIISVSPNPLSDTSGGAVQTVTVAVKNPGSSIGYYELSGSCGNVQLSSTFSIQPGSIGYEQVQVQTPYVPTNNPTLTTQCSFTVSDIYNSANSATGTFTEETAPLPAGQTSTVTTTVPQNAGCQSTNTCGANYDWIFYLIIILVLGVIAYALLKKKGKRR